MRLYIVRALVRKELHRHVSNKGGLVLAALLVVAAILLAVFKPKQGETGAIGGEFAGVRLCYIEFSSKSELIVELEKRIPETLGNKVQFRAVPPNLGPADLGLKPPPKVRGLVAPAPLFAQAGSVRRSR